MYKEVYYSIDIETVGPIPGEYSMISLGCAAFEKGNRTPLSTFEMNLQELPGAKRDPSTMEWWKTQPEAWEASTRNPIYPGQVMYKFNEWVKEVSGNRSSVAVVYPTWDYMFIQWYFCHFNTHNPFGLGCLDIKTKAHEILGGPFKNITKKKFPKHWFEGCPAHNHTALQDAIGQGILFINMSEDNLMY